jgi:hypothetical protein
LTEQYPDEIALIRYHMPYPGTDPFYLFNIPEASARIAYYGITGSSHLYIDGIVDAGYYSGVWDSLFNMQMDVPSPMEIGFEGTYNSARREVNLDITVIATDRIDWNDLRLQCVTIENHIHWVAPNGLRVHNQVMRDMVPDASGEAFRISEGDTVGFNRDFLLDNALDADSCGFIVFVQADSSRSILQAGRIMLPDLRPIGIRDDPGQLPLFSKIESCWPNPFNASIRINYSLRNRAEAIIRIYDIAGRRVAALRDGDQPEGEHSMVWDASALPSGIYFARLEIGGPQQSVKMLLLK